MSLMRVVAAMVLGLGVSACASVDTASRNAPFDVASTEIAAPAPSYQMAGFEVTVPRSLRVSEANTYYPGGDIVWRGDAYGDRYEQVKAMFEEGVRLGGGPLVGARPVHVQIEVSRFHALTEKTRYSVGGVHAIEFTMTIVDAQSGAVLRGPKPIKASLTGYGGQKALAAEARGLTQKYRITHHLAYVVREELTKAQGFVGPSRGASKTVQPLAPIGTEASALTTAELN
ncbi:hypothetical protein J7413_03680 [Shimia sp. R10_1]|uniref:DUF6778 family protein n=1 Tax=Shimia sp. R10_1 TaxID=2821095 RepID=UPI001ADD1E7F|nr:DUF6778 family protein [Shimia sp. R10_1]MBO9472629.1 hypothetical protein [Shimia sp. R10_1]